MMSLSVAGGDELGADVGGPVPGGFGPFELAVLRIEQGQGAVGGDGGGAGIVDEVEAEAGLADGDDAAIGEGGLRDGDVVDAGARGGVEIDDEVLIVVALDAADEGAVVGLEGAVGNRGVVEDTLAQEEHAPWGERVDVSLQRAVENGQLAGHPLVPTGAVASLAMSRGIGAFTRGTAFLATRLSLAERREPFAVCARGARDVSLSRGRWG